MFLLRIWQCFWSCDRYYLLYVGGWTHWGSPGSSPQSAQNGLAPGRASCCKTLLQFFCYYDQVKAGASHNPKCDVGHPNGLRQKGGWETAGNLHLMTVQDLTGRDKGRSWDVECGKSDRKGKRVGGWDEEEEDWYNAGCATFFVGGPYNQLQTSSGATLKFSFSCTVVHNKLKILTMQQYIYLTYRVNYFVTDFKNCAYQYRIFYYTFTE